MLSGDPKELGRPERFFRMLMDIPRIDKKVNGMLFQATCVQKMTEIEQV